MDDSNLQDRNDLAYWEGVRDGVAELSDTVATEYREGIRQAEALHDDVGLPPHLDLIRRDRVIEFLKGQARRLEGIAASIAEILETKFKNDPREGDDDDGNEGEDEG